MKKQVQQGRRPVFLSFDDPLIKNVRFESVMTLLVLAVCAALSAVTPHPVSAQVSVTQTNTRAAVQSAFDAKPEAQESQTDAPAENTASTPAAAPQSQSRPCQPNYSYSPRPAPLDISSRAPGLYVSTEGPYYYQVFGNSQAEVKTQLHACGPRDDFAGDASYSVNWIYALIRSEGSELCVLTSVKVGLRTQMLLPLRDNSLPLSYEWNNFSAGLAAHEQGHMSLSQQYASQLYTTLQNYPAGDCYTMSSVVEATAQQIVRELGAAQLRYDSATAHGATQGASW